MDKFNIKFQIIVRNLSKLGIPCKYTTSDIMLFASFNQMHINTTRRLLFASGGRVEVKT